MIQPKKALIFDSGAVITLALNNLLNILEPLKMIFRGEFFISEAVKKEMVDTPLKTKRYALDALMIEKLINKKVFRIISDSALRKETDRILAVANRTYKTDNEWIRIIHRGEASCLALFNLIEAEKKAVVIDERTTRMLCEKPENLRRLFEKKLHKKVKAAGENYRNFEDIKIIRTSELAFIAYRKRIINLPAKPKSAIRALLYAIKYKGCAISNREIEIAKKIK